LVALFDRFAPAASFCIWIAFDPHRTPKIHRSLARNTPHHILLKFPRPQNTFWKLFACGKFLAPQTLRWPNSQSIVYVSRWVNDQAQRERAKEAANDNVKISAFRYFGRCPGRSRRCRPPRN
jgi:hypothetical protein